MSDVVGRRALMGMTLALFASLSPGGPAFADNYPSRPITIVVPLAAGSGMDVLVRLYGERLSQRLGKPVIVENKPGAAMMIGTVQVANAEPDGYTLVVATSSALAINPWLYKQINYDPDKDFVPLAWYVKSPFILIVNPALPIKTVPELLKYAKEAKTPLNFSTPGAGTLQHLSMEFVKQRFNVNMTHVPYRQTPQSITDIAAGHVDLAFAEAGATIPLIKDGKLRALAVSAANRLPLLPDVPPFAEAAGVSDFEAVSWHMLLAPAKTPKEIVDKLHNELKTIAEELEMKERAAAIGLIPIEVPTIVATEAYVKSERAKWGALVTKLGLAGSQ